MSEECLGITLDPPRPGKRPGEFAFVSRNGVPIHSDEFRPTNGKRVSQFINETMRRAYPRLKKPQWPQDVREQLERQFASWAVVPPAVSGAATAPATTAEVAEIDVSRVVRPELFHTAEVSGLTLAVMTADGDKIVPLWRTYLRWADARREVIDRPAAIPVPSGGRMFLHPDPGDPSPGESPPWSSASRKKWVAGSASPDPVGVFRQLCEQIAYFIDLGDDKDRAQGAIATIALWVILTYAYPAWDAVPYLSIGGPQGSGKTRLLDILGRVAFRPLSSSNMTAPALFRTIHAAGGTLLYDEAERLRQANDPSVQEINSMLLAGYRRGGCAHRLEPVGDGFRTVKFDVFGPKVLACIAGLPPTLASRCIPFMMFRAHGESLKPKRRLDSDPATWTELRNDLHALALEHGPTWVKIANRRDIVPASISGRNFELWQPLLAIASWLQSCGEKTLLDDVQRYATSSVEESRDDAVPEADETVLEVLAEKVKECERPTPGELLSACKIKDEETFSKWQANTITRRLKSYGIPVPKKSHGSRRFDVTPRMLERIQTRYGIDLGCCNSEPTDPH